MFITPENLNKINLEFTDYCNAACPMCARFKWDGTLYKEKVNQNHNRLEILKKHIPTKIIKQLKHFFSVGMYGEPTINPECLDIYKWVKGINESCLLDMDSNGGTRNEKFWSELGELGMTVVFGLDGLEDTNHLYRRNVKWDKVMKNVKAFVSSGGQAHWKYIVFKHNQHQIDEAKQMSKDLGFKAFGITYSDRWKTSNWVTGETLDVDKWRAGNYYIEKPDSQKEGFYDPRTVGIYEEKIFDNKSKVVCQMASNSTYEIFIRANGYVQPCCMLGDIDVHESKELISNFDTVNLNKTPLPEILTGEYFKSLDKGIAGVSGSRRLKNCFYTCGVNN